MSGGGPGHTRVALAALALCALGACGKKGNPLPPLHLVPDAVTEVTARRAGDEVRLRFLLPSKNLNGPGPVNLDRVQVLAATIAAGASAPPNREFLDAKYVVGTIPVKPAPVEGQPPAAGDTRPAPGDIVVFAEELNEAKLRPQFTQVPPAAAAATPAPSAPTPVPSTVTPAPPTATPAAPTTTPAPSTVTPVRMYVIRGLARNGRPGQPSARVQVPLVPPPLPPADVAVKFTEKAVQVTWTPPAPPVAAKPPAFNVYASGGEAPLNPTPLAAPAFERAGVEFGREECFVVRSVEQYGAVTIESAPSASQCVTPADIFPPAAPTGLHTVASAGVISLIWQANTDGDLGGYLVLRGEAPGDTLQPVTATPIQETTYRDTSVKPGVRYVYAIVAVDRAKPANVSGQSPRVEETAR